MKNWNLYLFIFAISSTVTLLSFVMMPPEKIDSEQLFEKFINSFEATELPHEITFKNLATDKSKKQQNRRQKLSPQSIDEQHTVTDLQLITAQYTPFIPDVRRSLYSRRPPDRHFFKNKLFENDEMIVVTYGVSSYFTPNTVDKYILATYKKGKDIIASDRLIALRTIASDNGMFKMNCSVDTNLKITTMSAHPIAEDKDKIETEVFQIKEDGSIKVVVNIAPLEDKPNEEEPKSKEPLIKAF